MIIRKSVHIILTEERDIMLLSFKAAYINLLMQRGLYAKLFSQYKTKNIALLNAINKIEKGNKIITCMTWTFIFLYFIITISLSYFVAGFFTQLNIANPLLFLTKIVLSTVFCAFLYWILWAVFSLLISPHYFSVIKREWQQI